MPRPLVPADGRRALVVDDAAVNRLVQVQLLRTAGLVSYADDAAIRHEAEAAGFAEVLAQPLTAAVVREAL